MDELDDLMKVEEESLDDNVHEVRDNEVNLTK